MPDPAMPDPTPATPLLPPAQRVTTRTLYPPTSSSARPLLFAVPFAVCLPLIYMLQTAARPVAHQSAPTPVPLTMAALGDWGRYGRFGQTRVANALSRTLQAVSTRAVVLSTGDNFYKTGVASPLDPQFNASFEAVYSHLPLRTVPWYAILGNHDHLGSIKAQTSYTLRSQRWRMPAAYYTHRLSPHLLAIFLDTTPFVDGNYGKIARHVNGQAPAEQLTWLTAVLANADPHVYFLVVGHHNMYTMSTNDHLGVAEIRDKFEPILRPYHNRLLAYVSGHEHALMHMQPYPSDGYTVDHFLSGAGSKLSTIVEPDEHDREKWYNCCGILPVLNTTDRPRTVWGKSVNGFFLFQFDGSLFRAQVVDDAANVIYDYKKTVVPI